MDDMTLRQFNKSKVWFGVQTVAKHAYQRKCKRALSRGCRRGSVRVVAQHPPLRSILRRAP